MGNFAYNNESCLFFVGADNFKSNNVSAGENYVGGCTKEWWDTEVAASDETTALGKLMNDDGAPIVNKVASVSDFDEYWVKFGGSTGDYTGVEVGMILYAEEADDIFDNGDGLYKVIEIDTVNHAWIKLDADSVEGGIETGYEAELWIGGAWNDADTLAQEISAYNYSQEIWCNKDWEPSETIDVSSWGYGEVLRNTWLNIYGFNRVPGDIIESYGNYYQGINDVFFNSSDIDSFVRIGNDSLNGHLFDMSSVENIRFAGFYFHGTGDTGKSLFYANAASVNHIFAHCVFSGIVGGVSVKSAFEYTASHRLIIEDCYIDNSFSYNVFQVSYGTTIFRGAVNNIVDGKNFMGGTEEEWIISQTLNVNGQLVVNNGVGGEVYAFDISCIGQSFAAIRAGGSTGASGFVGSFSNIFKTYSQNVPAVRIREMNNNASIYISHNCAWSEGGQLDDVAIHEGANYPIPVVHNVIEEDPQFVGAGNFRPQNKNMLLGGAVDPGGVKKHMGCVGQEWQFSGSSRAGNVGRLGINK